MAPIIVLIENFYISNKNKIKSVNIFDPQNKNDMKNRLINFSVICTVTLFDIFFIILLNIIWKKK